MSVDEVNNVIGTTGKFYDSTIDRFMRIIEKTHDTVYCFGCCLLLIPEFNIAHSYKEATIDRVNEKQWPPGLFDNEIIFFPLNTNGNHWILAWFQVSNTSLYIVDPLCIASRDTLEVTNLLKLLEKSLALERGSGTTLKLFGSIVVHSFVRSLYWLYDDVLSLVWN